jgi:hypothetical protein
MNPDPRRPEGDDEPTPRRLYLFEPGWRVAMKVGNDREFCYMMAPGQDYYHRFYDGEIYLRRGDERICMACAQRRGLLSYAPRALRETLGSVEIVLRGSASEIGFGLKDEAGWAT